MKQINIQYTLENKRANASVEKLILSKVRWRVYMGVPCIIFTVWCGLKLIRIKSTVRDMRLNLKKKMIIKLLSGEMILLERCWKYRQPPVWNSLGWAVVGTKYTQKVLFGIINGKLRKKIEVEKFLNNILMLAWLEFKYFRFFFFFLWTKWYDGHHFRSNSQVIWSKNSLISSLKIMNTFHSSKNIFSLNFYYNSIKYELS